MLQIRGAGRKSRQFGHPLDQHSCIGTGRKLELERQFLVPALLAAGEFVRGDCFRQVLGAKDGGSAATRKKAVSREFDAQRATLEAELARHAFIEFGPRPQLLTFAGRRQGERVGKNLNGDGRLHGPKER